MRQKSELIMLAKSVDSIWIDQQLNWCAAKIEHNMQIFGEKFPSACATNGRYRLKDNDDWTNGFWTAMLWLSYEYTGKSEFKTLAIKNIESFSKRLDEHFVLDHHDIGFLYSLSTFAGYKLLKEPVFKTLTIRAADLLVGRFQKKGQFIQAWGKIGDPKEYRLIIDSLMNLPLLFEATKLSGDEKYVQVAKQHYRTLLDTVVKSDGTTYHTYYFDYRTGQPLTGITRQGHSNQSMWARGQSWAVLGIPLIENKLGHDDYPQIYQKITDVFINQLPVDLVPYWDFDFTDEQPDEKDSSSLAIVACGLLEAAKKNQYPNAMQLAKGMIKRLQENYTSRDLPENEGLLIHGVYAYSDGKGIDESNLWGDYFYFEALMRLKNPEWQTYW